jgi:hypothetical protein
LFGLLTDVYDVHGPTLEIWCPGNAGSSMVAQTMHTHHGTREQAAALTTATLSATTPNITVEEQPLAIALCMSTRLA